MSWRQSAKTVGRRKKPAWSSGSAGRPPPATSRAPCSMAPEMCRSTLARCSSEISAPVSVAGSVPWPSRISSARRPSSSTKRSWIVVLDDQPAAGRADLAAVDERRGQGVVDGRLEVGVGEDDVGALAAELERDALEVAGGAWTRRRPASIPPVRETRSTSGLDGERLADPPARPEDQVHDALRHPGLLDQPGRGGWSSVA